MSQSEVIFQSYCVVCSVCSYKFAFQECLKVDVLIQHRSTKLTIEATYIALKNYFNFLNIV